jgi:RES domain-containing protein
MISAWRICRKKYALNAFDGEGAAIYPGRWNLKGQKAVYTADSQALALLEIVVHADLGLAPLYVFIECSFDDSLIESIDTSLLPSGWQSLVAPSWLPLQRLGGEWLTSKRSPVLRVPTVLVPGQSNYVLNPEQPDFARIKTGIPIGFVPDSRLSHH